MQKNTPSIIAAVILLISGLLLSPAEAALVGEARVIDGDTIVVQGERIRLDGIDAPEAKQTCRIGPVAYLCGEFATEFLTEMIGGWEVTCTQESRDRYGRILGICYRHADGADLNGLMVEYGQAMAYRQYSKRYIEHEERAKQAGHGIWGTEFIEPWLWRRGER